MTTKPLTKEEAAAQLKELDQNKAKVWPAQNMNPKHHIVGIKPNGYGFVSAMDLKAAHRDWLRPVVVEHFDQSTYVEGTKPKRMKKEAKKDESVRGSD